MKACKGTFIPFSFFIWAWAQLYAGLFMHQHWESQGVQVNKEEDKDYCENSGGTASDLSWQVADVGTWVEKEETTTSYRKAVCLF